MLSFLLNIPGHIEPLTYGKLFDPRHARLIELNFTVILLLQKINNGTFMFN